MFERFRRRSGDGTDHQEERGGVATRPAAERAAPRRRFERGDGDGAPRAEGAPAATARDVRAQQHEEFGGLNWGSAFFGWLVAIGMAAILTAIVSAAGAGLGLTEVSEAEARGGAETIGVAGAVLLFLVLGIAYYCGGYVSGRMSRFDGARQGFGVWAIGLIATIVLAIAGAIFDAEYNVLARLELPRIPVDEGTLTAGGVITLAAIVIGTLVAALIGGKAGERYHRKVDRAGYGLR